MRQPPPYPIRGPREGKTGRASRVDGDLAGDSSCMAGGGEISHGTAGQFPGKPPSAPSEQRSLIMPPADSASLSRILHVMMDSPVCADTFRLFEELRPGANEAVVLNPSGPLRHVGGLNPRVLTWRGALSADFLGSLSGYAAVLLQYMDELKVRVVMAAPPGTRLVWLGWGGDYYDYHRFPQFEPATGELAARDRRLALADPRTWGGSLRRLAVRLTNLDVLLRPGRLFRRVAVFATLVPRDFELIREAVGDPMPVFRPYSFYSVEDLPGAEATEPGTARNVLLGNSATWTNNHLEVLRALPSPLPLGTRVITPLTYGDARCRRRVLKEGRARLGESFVPLLGHLPFDEYRRLTAGCGCLVLNHRRQQAVGNVLLMMRQGARIYLNAGSPLTGHLRSLGFILFTTDELAARGVEGLAPLDAESAERNRELMRRHWDRSQRLRMAGDLLRAAGDPRPGVQGA